MSLALRGKRIGKKGAKKAPFLLNDNMGNQLSFLFPSHGVCTHQDIPWPIFFLSMALIIFKNL